MNKFTAFVETYYEDIIAFLQSLIGFFKAAFGKIGGEAADAE